MLKIPLEELPNQDLRFLTNPELAEIKSEEQISTAAGMIVQDFRDLFLTTKLNDDELLALNRLCVRLVFCLYAEDAGGFKKRQFLDFLLDLRKISSLENFRLTLAQLFVTLSTKEEDREFMTSHIFRAFSYVDGELFKDDPTKAMGMLEFFERLDGKFDLREVVRALIDASENFNWSKISPTIFGSIFESILNPETKRADGIHFTSVANIHKAIDPLILDELNEEFDRCRSIEDFERLHDKIASLKFFDPACGSGNFLTETFISLRKLENRILEKIGGDIKVTIKNFYGIEINNFAVQVAKLALWISEIQMKNETNQFAKTRFKLLPLEINSNITEANSLETDWTSVALRDQIDFVLGNPPYVGYSMQTPAQKVEMRKIFHGNRAAGKMDYVCAWFKKASEYMRGTKIESTFVATNSITQGEHVGYLWQHLFEDGIKINFAHRSFKWFNETPNREFLAHVHCVVISFARFNRDQKWIFDGSEKILAKNINGYLLDAPTVSVMSNSEAFSDVPDIGYGSKPADGGNLIIESEDLDAFLKKDPRAKKYIRRFMLAKEFLYDIPRYCLWLVDAPPNEIKSMKNIFDRVKACKKSRLESQSPTTRNAAKTPWLFKSIRQPSEGKFIVIPEVSSELREYLPIGIMSSETIFGNGMLIISSDNLCIFGLISSRIHMIWTQMVCGRLTMRLRYSPSVYNNFPFPDLNSKQKSRIEKTAQQILDARANHPTSSLAVLYDSALMPKDLQKAHKKNDLAVLDAYGFPHDISESEIVAKLFEMYQNLVSENES